MKTTLVLAGSRLSLTIRPQLISHVCGAGDSERDGKMERLAWHPTLNLIHIHGCICKVWMCRRSAEDRLRISNLCLRWFQAHINMLNILYKNESENSATLPCPWAAIQLAACDPLCAFLVGDGVLYRNACVLYETNYICTLWSPTVIQDS